MKNDALIISFLTFFNRIPKFKLRLVLALVVPVIAGCAASESTDFESLRQLVCESRFQEAIPKLKAYSGIHEARARLFLGKAWMGLGEYAKAAKVFESGIRDFPLTLEAHKCRYKLALVAYLQGDIELAEQQFRLLAELKDGPLVAEAVAFAKRLSR